jgi:ATP-dependent exoDNAse (exonuclease V) beta subunit
VTFTNKATEEMKSRILKELHALSTDQKSDYRADLMTTYSLTSDAVNHRARKILIAILHDYSSFSISTIDKFFQQVIRAFAREIGVQGGYNLELDSDATLQQSIDNLFLDLNNEENNQLLTWLTNFAEERIEQSESWNPRKNIETLGKEIFKESYQNKAEETNRKLHDREFLSSYRTKLRLVKTTFEDKVTGLAKQLLQQIHNAGLTTESFKYGKASGMNNLNKIIAGDYNLNERFRASGEAVENCYTAKTTPKDVISAIENTYNPAFQQGINQLIEWLENDIIFYNSAVIILKNLNTLGILSDLAMHVKKLTDQQNSMLISDSNMLLNRIIDNSDTPFVYEKTGVNIDHFMVDEFQDTSVLQWKNFLPLISNSLAAGNFNLVVGDLKQSIYRWRNSDWKLLDEHVFNDFRKDQLAVTNLDTNWRSDINIVAFNN